MSRKKIPMVIKLDRSTMHVEDVEVPMKRTKDIISTLEYIMPAFRMIYKQSEKLDFSGHKELSNEVVRLQRNANSAVMLSDMLLDLLKCIYENQYYIVEQLKIKAEMTAILQKAEAAKKD